MEVGAQVERQDDLVADQLPGRVEPAAHIEPDGAVGAARLGTEAGEPGLVVFDMGGTTAKACLEAVKEAIAKSA